MPRLTKTARNIWGTLSGLEVQRTDIWTLDLEPAIRGISNAGAFSSGFISYELQLVSVALPSLTIKTDEFRRESSPILMPGFDEPVGPVKVVFRLDSAGSGIEASNYYSSNLVRFLFAWRSLVRSGRLPITTELEFNEDENFTGVQTFPDESYSIPYRYTLRLKLGRGSEDGMTLSTAQQFELRDAWLSSFQLDELSYTGAPQAAHVSCQFSVSDIIEHIPVTRAP